MCLRRVKGVSQGHNSVRSSAVPPAHGVSQPYRCSPLAAKLCLIAFGLFAESTGALTKRAHGFTQASKRDRPTTIQFRRHFDVRAANRRSVHEEVQVSLTCVAPC